MCLPDRTAGLCPGRPDLESPEIIPDDTYTTYLYLYTYVYGSRHTERTVRAPSSIACLASCGALGGASGFRYRFYDYVQPPCPSGGHVWLLFTADHIHFVGLVAVVVSGLSVCLFVALCK